MMEINNLNGNAHDASYDALLEESRNIFTMSILYIKNALAEAFSAINLAMTENGSFKMPKELEPLIRNFDEYDLKYISKRYIELLNPNDRRYMSDHGYMFNDDVTIDDLVSLFQPIKYLVKERPSLSFIELFDVIKVGLDCLSLEVCLDCLSLRDIMTISSMLDDYNIDIGNITNTEFKK